MKNIIIAFAFGVPANILSNINIATIASNKAKKLGSPIYTQIDIQINSDVEVKYIEEKPDNLPTTLRMARGVVQLSVQNGYNEIWIVAAKPHLWRCIRDLNEAIREYNTNIKIKICEEIYKYSANEWFCKDSKQTRTRSQFNWWIREVIIKLIPFSIYKKIAN